MRQNVLAADLVVEGVEAVAGFCLRFRVQRRLQFHFAHQRCGLLPCSRSVGQRVDFLDHALTSSAQILRQAWAEYRDFRRPEPVAAE